MKYWTVFQMSKFWLVKKKKDAQKTCPQGFSFFFSWGFLFPPHTQWNSFEHIKTNIKAQCQDSFVVKQYSNLSPITKSLVKICKNRSTFFWKLLFPLSAPCDKIRICWLHWPTVWLKNPEKEKLCLKSDPLCTRLERLYFTSEHCMMHNLHFKHKNIPVKLKKSANQ